MAENAQQVDLGRIDFLLQHVAATCGHSTHLVVYMGHF